MCKNIVVKKVLMWMLQVLGLVAVMMFSVFPFSCRMTPEGVEIVGSEYKTPVIENYSVQSDDCMQICFSDKVRLNSVVVSEVNEVLCTEAEDGTSLWSGLAESLEHSTGIETNIALSEDEKKVLVNFVTPTEVGRNYRVYGEVEDKTGATLTFSIGFIGFNSRVPEILFSEIITAKKSQTDREKREGIVKTEALELFVAKGGNLAGVVIKSGYDGNKKDFVFPAVEVKTGEVIVVHPRKIDSDAFDELGEDLNLSKGIYSLDNVRDFWGDSYDAHYGDKTDVLLIENSIDGRIIDAVKYADLKELNWKKDLQIEYALAAKDQRFFESEALTDSIDAGTLTATRSIYRIGLSELAQDLQNGKEYLQSMPFRVADWAISDSSKETIGILN